MLHVSEQYLFADISVLVIETFNDYLLMSNGILGTDSHNGCQRLHSWKD